MADDYVSVPDGLLLVATLVLWSLALDWLDFHFPLIAASSIRRHWSLCARAWRTAATWHESLSRMRS
jgi:hypothetical protein